MLQSNSGDLKRSLGLSSHVHTPGFELDIENSFQFKNVMGLELHVPIARAMDAFRQQAQESPLLPHLGKFLLCCAFLQTSSIQFNQTFVMPWAREVGEARNGSSVPSCFRVFFLACQGSLSLVKQRLWSHTAWAQSQLLTHYLCDLEQDA